MKKLICVSLLFVMVSLLFTGCSVSFRSSASDSVVKPSSTLDSAVSEAKDKKLTFIVTQEMKDQGVTPENTESVKVLRDIITANPTIGAENDFTISYSGKQGILKGQKFVAFFAVNKTDHTLNNINFRFTMKVGDNYIIKDQDVKLTEKEFGAIASYTAMPVSIIISDKQYDLLSQATNSNLSLSITDFKAEQK